MDESTHFHLFTWKKKTFLKFLFVDIQTTLTYLFIFHKIRKIFQIYYFRLVNCSLKWLKYSIFRRNINHFIWVILNDMFHHQWVWTALIIARKPKIFCCTCNIIYKVVSTISNRVHKPYFTSHSYTIDYK